MSKYPATIGALVVALLATAVVLILFSSKFHADNGQVALIIGVIVLAVQQLLGMQVAESTAARVSAVEKVANDTANTVASVSANVTPPAAPPTIPVP